MAEKKKTLGSVLNEGLNGQFARAMEKLSPVEKNFCDFMEENYKAKFVDYTNHSAIKPKRTIKHPEDTFHKQINQYLSILLNQSKIGFYSYDASGEYRTKITGALLKSKGLKKGKPDYMVLHTSLGGITYILWLEAKAGTNKQTKEQVEFEARASLSKNEIYRVVRNIEDVQKAYEEFRRISA